MSALDTAKEIGRMATTATLGKDVIDLLKEKAALLTEQIAALEQEKSVLKTETSNLQKKVVNLEEQLERFRPRQDGLDDTAKKFIKMLFEAGSFVDFEHIAAQLGVAKGRAAYYIDVLLKAGMINGAGIVWGDSLGAYELTSNGRQFAVKSGLA